ncbi:MAG: hypothetical protein LBG77_05820 [Dysgonamonadaceae bacterium]|nr:hypothetical protein [Dysgonamonadaceae bacterium]
MKFLSIALITSLLAVSAFAQGIYQQDIPESEASTTSSSVGGQDIIMTYDNVENEGTGGLLRAGGGGNTGGPGGQGGQGAGPGQPLGEGLVILSVLAGGYAAAKKSQKSK